LQDLTQKGYPCALSEDAGTYVCNALFYRVMFFLADSGVPAGFIHLPPAGDSWTEEKLTDAVRMAIGSVLAT